MTLGSKIRNLRHSRNESLENLAIKLDISKTAVGKWENDISKPSLENLLKICNHYETDVYSLLENVKNINFSHAKFKGNQYVISPNNSTINYSSSPELITTFITNQKIITELLAKQNDLILTLIAKK